MQHEQGQSRPAVTASSATSYMQPSCIMHLLHAAACPMSPLSERAYSCPANSSNSRRSCAPSSHALGVQEHKQPPQCEALLNYPKLCRLNEPRHVLVPVAALARSCHRARRHILPTQDSQFRQPSTSSVNAPHMPRCCKARVSIGGWVMAHSVGSFVGSVAAIAAGSTAQQRDACCAAFRTGKFRT